MQPECTVGVNHVILQTLSDVPSDSVRKLLTLFLESLGPAPLDRNRSKFNIVVGVLLVHSRHFLPPMTLRAAIAMGKMLCQRLVISNIVKDADEINHQQ